MFKQNPPQGCLLVNDPNPWWYDKITLPKPSMILPVAQEEEYLVNNLASNADCELPCWWGIKPGETTSQSVQQMFLNLGKIVSRQEDDRGLQYQTSLFGRHSPYPFDYTVKHRWFDKNGIVNLFSVTGTALDWSPPQHFAQDWNRYALHEALARYGVPSKVLVHYWTFGWQYNIALVYEDQGIPDSLLRPHWRWRDSTIREAAKHMSYQKQVRQRSAFGWHNQKATLWQTWNMVVGTLALQILTHCQRLRKSLT